MLPNPEPTGRFTFAEQNGEAFSPHAGGGLLRALSRICLLVVLLAAPWAFGGTEPDVEFRLNCGVMLALGLWGASLAVQRLRTGSLSLTVPLVLVPVALAIGLGLLQLGIPATTTVQRPNRTATAPAKTNATISLPAFQGARTLSPAVTRTQVARLVFAAAALLLGAALFSDRASARWLWGALAINGGALAFFGLVQQLSWNGKLYWTVPLQFGAPAFASFVNRNNAAGYLNLCLAAAVAVFLLSRRSSSLNGDDSPDDWDTPRRSPALSIFAFGLIALIATGIVATSSRGGTLALGAAGVVTMGLLFSRDRFRELAGAGAALLGLCLLLGAWVGLGDRVGERWKSASLETFLQDHRWAHWRDAFAAVGDFPVLGSGLGTYRYAYLPYQETTSGVRYFNADNQYVEGLLEGGIVGLALMLTAGLAGAACVASLIRRSAAGTADPFVVVGAFVLVSQGVAALFDFGVSISATMLALAVLVGSIAGRAGQTPLSAGWSAPRFPRLVAFTTIRNAALATTVCLVFLAGGAWSLRELSASSQAWRNRRSIPRLERPDAMTDDEITAAIARLEQDAEARPDDAETHQALADLWIYRFRQREFLNTAQMSTADRQRAWEATDPLTLAGQANVWARQGQLERVRMVAEAPAVRESLLPAIPHLEAARRACAWLPWTDLTLATLRFVDQPRPPAVLDELRHGLHILPSNDSAWFRAGLLASCAGDDASAWSWWRRTLVLAPTRISRIRPLVANRLTLSEQIASVYPDSPELLLKLAEQAYASPQDAESRHALVDRALSLLSTSSDARPAETSKSLALRAHATSLRDQGTEAIELYSAAIQLAPYDAELRCELAETYRKQGDLRRALEQAEISLALAPAVRRTQTLLSELRSMPPGEMSTRAAGSLSPSPMKSMNAIEQVGYRPSEPEANPVKSPR